MKTRVYFESKRINEDILLHDMISRLLCSIQPEAVKKNSFFVNDVPAAFTVCTDKNILSAVISNLLLSILSRAGNSCIHISVKQYNNIVLLHLKDSNPLGTINDEYDFRELNPMAEKLGGCITANISNFISNITLSFRSFLFAA
jgi:hypothetical protein